ncbi:S1 family peptidase [Vibrio parahaemolyticus]|uniref:S1 family peptidase n=1 Tax=Vibrio parahaemolyticus TaxID=670 RepID=UPI00044D1247|nr:serine protease [Vibrio parahaemolyticus]EVT83464.1 trypsin-like peptidase domain protein [Vibrio parahaemolyticus VP2007-007]
MNLDNLGTQLTFTTVHLWIENQNGSNCTGTGFIYTVNSKVEESTIPFLVTNYHVVKDAKIALVEFIEGSNQKPNKDQKLRVEISGEQLRQFVDAENDLVVYPIAPILNQFHSAGKGIFYRTISPEMIPTPAVVNAMGAIEEVTFIGYPSGIYDFRNSSPLVRRGITSSPIWNDFNGEHCFIIDAGVFPGSSGSPVFILNQGSFAASDGVVLGSRLLFIGIISETMLREEGVNSNVYLGLGKVIKAQQLQLFIDNLLKEIDK